MITTATEYHLFTSYHRHTLGGHVLDWQNQPTVYKVYPGMDHLPLPSKVTFPSDHLSALLGAEKLNQDPPKPDAGTLSRLLLLTYSPTTKTRYAEGEFCYRSVASAGALYPTELYVACHRTRHIADGLYHYSLPHHSLCPLRSAEAIPSVAATLPARDRWFSHFTFFLSAIFFRSAWKYRERSYRYHLLDTGHVLEQLLLSLRLCGLPALVSYDFADHAANRLLGFDETKEVCLALCRVLATPERASQNNTLAPPDPPRALTDASRVAAHEVDYPPVWEIHQAGSAIIGPPLFEPQFDLCTHLGVEVHASEQIDSSQPWPERLSYAQSVSARRSRRKFTLQPLPHGHFTALVNSLCTRVREDALGLSAYDQTLAVGILVGNVDQVAPGFYLLRPDTNSLGLVRPGLFTRQMARLCLDQEWLSRAALHFLFLTNLEVLDRYAGARGYRYALMSAGRLGQRLYLVATSLGIGCCGIGAFYDDEAVTLLDLDRYARLLYLVAIGQV
jgi:SagB-type dehydrogenase family enzyme